MKKFKLNILVCISIGLLMGLSACDKKSTKDETVAATTNEFSSLAEVTGPVTGVSSSGLSAKLTSNIGILAATTGVSLSSPGTFSSGTSLQLCENANYTKEILREAASPDKILCYMSKMKANGVIPSTLNLSDGNSKYIKLVNLPGGGGGGNSNPLVKFQIVKSGNAIASFKMWSCFSGTASAPEQSEYISELFNELTATVTSKYKGSESGATFGSSMTASGTFVDGAWSSKNISGYRYFSHSGNSNVMTINMNQYADRIDMSIAMKGRYSSSTYTNKFYSVMQILNGASLSTLALGDGSSKYSMSYDSDSNGSAEFSEASTKSWSGDSKMNLSTASSGDYYTAANAGTVPADPNSAQTVSFSTDEAWDCTLPSGESWTEADFNVGGSGITEGMQACESKYLGSGGGWINCPY
tara:strand:+ start:47195 stop:48433 length:1239 start_codon:yes stop_codon:yes gene_type:complete